MYRATPEMRSLAMDLVAYETCRDPSLEAIAPAAFEVIEKLRPRMVSMMGAGGFRGLVSRALVRANGEVPWLLVVHVKADGSLEGFEGSRSKIDSREFVEGAVVVLSQVLELLVGLIGASLTSRLVGEIWPECHSIIWISGGGETQSARAR
jgi:hypothetical protein